MTRFLLGMIVGGVFCSSIVIAQESPLRISADSA